MEKIITVIVEFADNNLSAYVKEVDGIAVTANDLDGIKASAAEAIELYAESCKEMDIDLPEALQGGFKVQYKYDLCSFLQAYSGILSKAGLENLTGINQKQLWHYASGRSKPRPETVKKVADSIHSFACELAEVEFA